MRARARDAFRLLRDGITTASSLAIVAALGRRRLQAPFLDRRWREILLQPREGEILGTLEIPMADGRLITQQVHAVEDVYGRPVGHLWLFQDVTRERQTADQLIYLAERDALTGLYNRHRFNDELARMIADAQRHSSRVALLFFDLDDFKYINDTFGHRAGDAMLIRVAGEVAGRVRRNEMFARLGGDEFAILVPEISEEMLRVLAERAGSALYVLHMAAAALPHIDVAKPAKAIGTNTVAFMQSGFYWGYIGLIEGVDPEDGAGDGGGEAGRQRLDRTPQSRRRNP